jgi:hypothetical protein
MREQFGTGVYDYACQSPQAVFEEDSVQCQTIKTKAVTCTRSVCDDALSTTVPSLI